ncbi:MAG TPA: ribosome biogenesis GTPase Der [Firmicutes bacterium]|nr:ribosome biogenesis GTPase Der [Candidatus Fermentithermobacillaceae bacterium]
MDYAVAIVGRPNVGKSALFNRIAGAGESIVHRESGVTRDRLYARCSWLGHEFTLLDTGGFELSSTSELARAIRVQIEQAIEEADLLIFVVDARTGIMPEDEEIANILRKAQKPVLVSPNKCDAPGHDHKGMEFYSLGFPEVFPISAAHGLGVGDLLDRVIEAKEGARLRTGKAKGEGGEAEEDSAIRVAIVGKPNVGKSSLANKLVGQPRMTVSAMPGTTVDAVDIRFTYDNTDFVLVDTAGLRRPARIGEKLEELAVGRALRAVKRCDIAILVLDGTELPTTQDRRIAGYIRRNLKASILVANKVDLGLFEDMTQEAFTSLALSRCRPMGYSNVLFSSCVTGKGIDMILPEVIRIYQEYDKRIGTSLLNQVVGQIADFSPPPRDARLFYCTQAGTQPPTMVFFVKDPSKMPDSYARYLESEIRRRFGFRGVPIVMEFRPHRRKGRLT